MEKGDARLLQLKKKTQKYMYNSDNSLYAYEDLQIKLWFKDPETNSDSTLSLKQEK